MPNPKPGSKRYKGPVHEAVRSALGVLGIDTNPRAPTVAKSRPEQLAANKAAYAVDAKRLAAYRARTAPKAALGAAIGATLMSGSATKASKKRATTTTKRRKRAK